MGREMRMEEDFRNRIEDRNKDKKDGINAVLNLKNDDGNLKNKGVESNRNDRQDQKKFFENLTWLTSNEAADYLRLPSVGALRVLVCKRRLPFHKLGRSLRFKRVELDRLLEASKHFGGF